jgi:ABC-type microcin C transport system permease subunit YejE
MGKIALIVTKIGLATFWVIFSQTRLVTVISLQFLRMNNLDEIQTDQGIVEIQQPRIRAIGILFPSYFSPCESIVSML